MAAGHCVASGGRATVQGRPMDRPRLIRLMRTLIIRARDPSRGVADQGRHDAASRSDIADAVTRLGEDGGEWRTPTRPSIGQCGGFARASPPLSVVRLKSAPRSDLARDWCRGTSGTRGFEIVPPRRRCEKGSRRASRRNDRRSPLHLKARHAPSALKSFGAKVCGLWRAARNRKSRYMREGM